MIEPEKPFPVKFIVAALKGASDIFSASREEMIKRWGTIDFEGKDVPFDVTDYYETEMGMNLTRCMLSFEKLISPDRIIELKLEASEIEKKFAHGNNRQVNLDVGYLDTNKLVLASFKYLAQKIYLGQGVWADPVCYYRKGHFHPFEWSFLDFKDSRYEKDLLSIREKYKHGR